MSSAPVSTQQQWLAASPELSVWVSANAGSGKTKVLTDRVLRLLLEGVLPHRILCLTYTKAAAAEMSLRIQNSLRGWVVLSDVALQEQLSALLRVAPNAKTLQKARQLFATVVDNPEGIRIQTIHSLCQSLLRKFSLEAGVSPHFRLMSDHEAFVLLEEAKNRFLSSHLNEDDGKLMQAAVSLIAENVSESMFHELLNEGIRQRRHLSEILRLSPQQHQEHLRMLLAIPKEMLALSVQELVAHFFRYSDAEIRDLRKIAEIAAQGTEKTDLPFAVALGKWLDSSKDETSASAWVSVFYTQKDELKKKPLTANVVKKMGDLVDVLEKEISHISAYHDLSISLMSLRMSQAAWHVTQGMQAQYHTLKLQRGLLDYEDLIAKTSALIQNPRIAPWVMFKLDGGIDHILVDEAQDTSLVQWQLVQTLANEFFSGETASKADRTLFVVGDEKQSIYSFQGAEPAAFNEMKHHFARQIKNANKRFEAVQLLLSYRSTAPVLQAVDAVFHSPEMQKGVIEEGTAVRHAANRMEGGRVELWPLMKGDDEEERESFSIADAQVFLPKADKLLAEHIAETIAEWLRSKRWLEGRGRPVCAGDIMILVRNRSGLFYHLLTALKQKNIPLAGADRLKLTEHIAVHDLCALGDFLLLPEDDLSLACVLKSPLFGFSEDDIYTLCQSREKTVWQKLQEQTLPHFTVASETLQNWLSRVDYMPVFEFYAEVLEAWGGRQKFIRRMGDEVQDPLSEFLSLTLEYEQLHQPSMQGFLHWFRQIPIEIKRDLEQTRDALRILTIHGSKGLEAPVVILPDTTSRSKDEDRLFFNVDMPSIFWNFKADSQPERLKLLRNTRKAKAEEEERRLLYVALTRAADELYIAGYQGKQKIPENCWYQRVKNGLEAVAVSERVLWQGAEDHKWVLSNESAVRKELAKEARGESRTLPPLPVWVVGKESPEEPRPPKPLTPSRADVAEENAEAIQVSASVLQRGKAIHLLLEILPELEAELRQNAGLLLLKQNWPVGNLTEHLEALQQVTEILAHPEFSAVFGHGSQAEVPITALVEDEGVTRILAGQIDRLVVTSDGVFFVDYKTNRLIPKSQLAVSERYIQQLRGYQLALKAIYPPLPIRAAILWTNGPMLMPISI